MRPPRSPSPKASASRCSLTVSVEGSDYQGFVVLDSIVNGRSAGGVRIVERLAVDEVRELASEMTKKFGLFLLPRGGAKAGIQMDPALPEARRQEALEDFGRRIAPLIHGGLYYPGMDLNCGPESLRAIYRGAEYMLGDLTDSSLFTALSIHHCLDACADFAFQPGSGPLRLAIEGFGSVARHLAERLDPQRYRIVAVSTLEGAVLLDGELEPRELARRKQESGDAFVRDLPASRSIRRDELLSAEVDILLPSSRTWVIDLELAGALPARCIVPIANAPYAEGARELLERRGVLCLPGYVSNVGGVLASSLFDLGLPVEQIEGLFAREYRAVVDGILGRSRVYGGSPTAVCEELLRLHDRGRSMRPPQSGLIAKLNHRFVEPRLPRSRRADRARRDYLQRMQRILRELGSLEAPR